MKISKKNLFTVICLVILIVSVILLLVGQGDTDMNDDIEKKCRKICEKKYRPGTAAFKICVDGCKFGAKKKPKSK